MAQHRQLVNMKISEEAVEWLMEEEFCEPVRKRPVHPQVRGCPSAELWQRKLLAKEIFTVLVSLLNEQDEEGTCRLQRPAQK